MRYRRNRDLLNVDYPLLLNYEVSLYVMSLFVFGEKSLFRATAPNWRSGSHSYWEVVRSDFVGWFSSELNLNSL